MRAVVQRVTSSKVVVDGKIVGSINKGINVLIGISCDDNEGDLKYIKDKIINLRSSLVLVFLYKYLDFSNIFFEVIIIWL